MIRLAPFMSSLTLLDILFREKQSEDAPSFASALVRDQLASWERLREYESSYGPRANDRPEFTIAGAH